MQLSCSYWEICGGIVRKHIWLLRLHAAVSENPSMHPVNMQYVNLDQRVVNRCSGSSALVLERTRAQSQRLSMSREWHMCIWVYEYGHSLYYTVLFVVLSSMSLLYLSQYAQYLAPIRTLHTSDMASRLFPWKLAQTAHCVTRFPPVLFFISPWNALCVQ